MKGDLKRLFWGLWLENKQNLFLAGMKVFFLLMNLLGVVAIAGYPYAFLYSWVAYAIGPGSIRGASQIEYLAPRTREEIRRDCLRRCLLTSLFYSGVNLCAYLLGICCLKRYSWSVRMVEFLVLMSLLMFLHAFFLRLFLERLRYGWSPGYREEDERKRAGKLAFDIGVGVSSIPLLTVGSMAVIFLMATQLMQETEMSWLSELLWFFRREGCWRLLLVSGCAVAAGFLAQIRYCGKKLEIGDYPF